MKTSRCPVLAARLTSLVGAAVPRTARAQALPALLSKDRNPAAAGVVEDALVRRGFEIFDVDHEKRWYDRVDQLDGLTLGWGNWPQGELAAVLTNLNALQGGRGLGRDWKSGSSSSMASFRSAGAGLPG